MKILNKIIPALLMIALFTPAKAQDDGIEGTLRDLVSNNAKLYMTPFVTAFGTGMNSGIFRRAKPHKILGFDLTLNVTLTTIPEAGLTYDFYFPDEIPFSMILGGTSYPITLNGTELYSGDKTAPTFFGTDAPTDILPDDAYAFNTVKSSLISQGVPASTVDAQETFIRNAISSDLSFTPPGGIDFSILPGFMPQFALGLPFGTEIMFRGFTLTNSEGDQIKFGGFGAKLYLNKLLPTIPLVFPALSVGYYVTNLDMAGIITSKNSILTLQVSKSIPVFTVYGGFGIEKSDIAVKVNADDGTNILDFSLDGDNSFRTIIGVRIKLLLLSINVDYNIGEYTATNIGIGLTLR